MIQYIQDNRKQAFKSGLMGYSKKERKEKKKKKDATNKS